MKTLQPTYSSASLSPEDMENSLFSLSLKHPFTYLKTAIMTSLSLLFPRLNKLILSLFLHNSCFLILWSKWAPLDFLQLFHIFLWGRHPNFLCFPTKAAEWQHCFVLLKDKILLTYPSLLLLFMCPVHWRHPFRLAQIIPNCNPVLLKTCCFCCLHVLGTSQKCWDQPSPNCCPPSSLPGSSSERWEEWLTLGRKD